MRDACQVWGQSKNWLLTQIRKSQNKALRQLNFKNFMKSSNPRYGKIRQDVYISQFIAVCIK